MDLPYQLREQMWVTVWKMPLGILYWIVPIFKHLNSVESVSFQGNLLTGKGCRGEYTGGWNPCSWKDVFFYNAMISRSLRLSLTTALGLSGSQESSIALDIWLGYGVETPTTWRLPCLLLGLSEEYVMFHIHDQSSHMCDWISSTTDACKYYE